LPGSVTGENRLAATALFQASVAAADPALALEKHLKSSELPDISTRGRYILLAIGKAAVAMMETARRLLPDAAEQVALVVTNTENARPVSSCRVIAAGHPVPDDQSALAGLTVAKLATSARAQDHVIAMISGGGSALLCAPAPGLTLADKAAVNRIMLAAGLDITETNLVRQQLSTLKGGKLAALAAPARVDAFILSDVIGDDLRAIASGPCAGPIGTRGQAVETLNNRGIFNDLPQDVHKHLLASDPGVTPPENTITNTLIGSNRQSLESALAAAGGRDATIVSDRLVGDVADAAGEVLSAMRNAPTDRPVALIFGGETTVTLRGDGRGGRNQELALRVALGADGIPGDWVFLSGGTDGRDGPTDAAGGLVDGQTVRRMRAHGVDPATLLANNDSHAALAVSGDLLMTGATGTNVADVQIFLRGRAD